MKIIQRFALLALSIAVLSLTFYINYTSQLTEFENTARSKEAVVNEYINISSNFIDMMTIYGNSYLKGNNVEDSELLSFIEYDEGQNRYSLDALKETKYEPVSGNLTGSGNIPQSDTIKNELNLALAYNEFFSSFYKSLPDVTWIYYTSENDFINLYPWTYSGDFAFSEELHSISFYSHAKPASNPLRQPVWSPVYLDEAGQGLMVTLSSPIYKEDTFMGVVSLDLTTERLGALIDSKYKSYLVDTDDSVITASQNVEFDPKEVDFSKLLGMSESATKELKQTANYSLQMVQGNYVYNVSFENSPWELYLVTPVWAFIGRAALYTLPILVICILLFLTVLEGEKHKKTQAMLSSSLEEIKSYHALLENAARHDFLTNTCNRRGLAEDFHEHVETNNESCPPIAFIMGDIDEFKHFNDTFGHTAGDRILVELANIMKENTTDQDIICRWGGEEYVIMLYNKTYEEAMSVAEKLRTKIQNNVIPWTESTMISATMTFGVAEYDYGNTMQNSISKADSALYYGKNHGRNRVVGYRDLPVDGNNE